MKFEPVILNKQQRKYLADLANKDFNNLTPWWSEDKRIINRHKKLINALKGKK